MNRWVGERGFRLDRRRLEEMGWGEMEWTWVMGTGSEDGV